MEFHEDAINAGTENSHSCTLILTKGDSAMLLTVAGLSVVGRDNFGVYSLRKKLLNVREATSEQVLANAQINQLIKIIGLKYEKKYQTMDDLKSLRYGKILMLFDRTVNGSLCKGLLINFIHTFWPELLRLPFLEEFVTPVVQAYKKKKAKLWFYSVPDFEEWKASTPDSNTFTVQHYIGLGTSSSNDAKVYFKNMDRNRVLFKYSGAEDDESILLAFAKNTANQRREWLESFMEKRIDFGLEEKYLYIKTKQEVYYHEFINTELILYFEANNFRTIPSLVDGLKPTERKILFTCFKRKDKKSVRVAQLAGSVAELAAYHHHERALCSSIINLAQNFVGSNNINLLIPPGHFGTRLDGGEDCPSYRYLFTMMSPIAPLIFHPDDDPLLSYRMDDKQKIEPIWYIPIIPLILVNGAEGTGTGWSTSIPRHNPRDIIEALRNIIDGKELQVLHPWYKNFSGTVQTVDGNKYVTLGNVTELDSNRIEITELPIGTWTNAYIVNVLEPLLQSDDPMITDYKEYQTDTTIRFVITFAQGVLSVLRKEPGGFNRIFKLSSNVSTNQMYCFNSVSRLRHYENVNLMLREFYVVRLEFYRKRKNYLVRKLTAESERLTDQTRFISEISDGIVEIYNREYGSVLEELVKRGYRPDPVMEWKQQSDIEDDVEVDGDEMHKMDVEPTTVLASIQNTMDYKNFNYLLGMPVWVRSKEMLSELIKQRDAKLNELAELKSKSPEAMWLSDLKCLELKLDEVEAAERMEQKTF